MKIQCACGAKYAFDVTPEMAARPVQFICPGCGADCSVTVNEMIRAELGPAQTPLGVLLPAAVVETPVAQAAPAAPAPEVPAAPEICLKHYGEPLVDHCRVCGKPICLKCMQIFGYLCSAFCKSKAEAQRLDIPVYAGQRHVAEAREWRKMGRIAGSIAGVIAVVLGVWFWFAWFGQKPKAIFSARFAKEADGGKARLAGKDQLVLLRGGTLERYDLKSRKKVWSRSFLDAESMTSAMAGAVKDAHALLENQTGKEGVEMPSIEAMTRMVTEAAFDSLQLHVVGSNIWVATLEGITRFDWNSGQPAQVIAHDGFHEPVRRENQLLLQTERDTGQISITRVDLASGESTSEDIGGESVVAASGGKEGPGGAGAIQGGATAGLPIGVPGADRGRPLNPAKVAEQVQSLPYASRIALPAVLANSQVQERTLAAVDGDFEFAGGAGTEFSGFRLRARDFNSMAPGPHGFVRFSARVVEERIVARQAMKDPPKKSVLDGNLTVTQTAEVANEILNEMQRSRGGSTVEVDESRYLVTIHSPDGKAPEWTGEVTGPPSLFPLKTVNVLAAGTSLIVLDRSNRKLWTSALSHPLQDKDDLVEQLLGESNDLRGEGPCVERGNRLYVFDQAVLTAFDLASGNAKWRLPTVGVSGLFFDDQGMMYVNTTSAGLDTVKFSRQIDVTRDDGPVVLKVDPETGKTLWGMRAGSHITHVSGKYLFIAQWSDGDLGGLSLGLLQMSRRNTKPWLRIRRIDPDNGRAMWDHYEQRAPLDVRFEGNRILLVFSKEVKVLRFLSL